MNPPRRLLLLLVLFACCSVSAKDLAVGTMHSRAGESVSGYLEIPAAGDAGTRIPVSLIAGTKPGPTLALIAGTHGYEYPGITALQQLRQSLDPGKLSGTLILVHIANPPSFYGRTIYVSPVDGKNLNRVFPGKQDGTLSERIAFTITREVIEHADFLVDLHAGDGNEALRPYVYMPVTGVAKLDTASRGMALAFMLDHIVIDESPLAPRDSSLYVDMTALTRGVPAITTETGQLGANDERTIALALRGIENLMRHLGMLEGEPAPNEGVVWLRGYEVIRSPGNGVFRAAVRDGYSVAKDSLLGELFDAFGKQIAEIRAPFAGVVNYVIGTPPISEGEPVAMISRISAEEAQRLVK